MSVNVTQETSTFDLWKEMMVKYDHRDFTYYQIMPSSEIRKIREFYRAMRIAALKDLNTELNPSGLGGSIGGMDVADHELYPYVNAEKRDKFYIYSRILDFADGYKPTTLTAMPQKPHVQVVESLDYWKCNAEEDYIKTPISVLKYISKLESEIKQLELPDGEIAVSSKSLSNPYGKLS